MDKNTRKERAPVSGVSGKHGDWDSHCERDFWQLRLIINPLLKGIN